MTPSPRSLRLLSSSALIALLATAVVPLVSAPLAQAAEGSVAVSAAPHRLGWKLRPGKRIAAGRRVKTLGIAAADVLPATVDLTAKTIAPGDQGSVGSCVAWSEGYTMAGYYANAQSQYGAPFAPMYLYSQIHLSSSADGGGAYTSTGWNVLAAQGIAEKSVYSQGDFNFTTLPTDAQKANAAQHKMSAASYLFSGDNQGAAGIAALKGALASGNPVEIGIPVYGSFFSLSSTDSVMTLAKASGTMYGGHVMVAVGYNATGLVIENSWGTAWGAAGYATLAWDFVGRYVSEASATTGFAAGPVVPAVTALSATSGSTVGGGTLTVSGSALAAVDASAAGAVTLVNVANSSVWVNAPVASRTSTSLTVMIPPAPLVSGRAVAGAYRVQVTSSAGASVDNGTKDDFTYIAPADFVVTEAGAIAASSGATLTLTGSGFGATKAAATALKLSATVSAQTAKLTWVSDTAVKIVVPAGVPGQVIPIVVSRSGVLSATNTSLSYAANISSLKVRSESSGARYASLVGRGFSGATDWKLTSPDGTQTTALPVVTSTTSLATGGVLIDSDTAAQFKLPVSPAGGVGNFRVSFTPNQTTYPGAALLASAVAVVPYSAPTITKVSATAVAAGGGAVLTVTGANLATVDRSNPAAVRLVSSSNSAIAVNVPVTGGSGTSLTLILPPAPSASGTQVLGDYRLVASTGQGSATAASVITYLAPFAITAPAGTVLLTSGRQTVTVSGTGFGATAAEFKALTVTATVAGRTVPVSWVSATSVRVAATVTGAPGSMADLIVYRRGIPSNILTLAFVAGTTRT